MNINSYKIFKFQPYFIDRIRGDDRSENKFKELYELMWRIYKDLKKVIEPNRNPSNKSANEPSAPAEKCEIKEFISNCKRKRRRNRNRNSNCPS